MLRPRTKSSQWISASIWSENAQKSDWLLSKALYRPMQTCNVTQTAAMLAVAENKDAEVKTTDSVMLAAAPVSGLQGVIVTVRGCDARQGGNSRTGNEERTMQ